MLNQVRGFTNNRYGCEFVGTVEWIHARFVVHRDFKG